MQDLGGVRAQHAADEQALNDLAKDRYATCSITDGEFRSESDLLIAPIADAQESLADLAAPG